MKNQLIVGDRFEGVLLETFIDNRSTRPRVRPLDYFNSDLRVEFPRHLREDNPIGTRFRADVKVAQKTMNNQPYGSIYLVATDHTIEKVEDFIPDRMITAYKLNTASDRSYEYIEKEFKKERNLIPFIEFRERAYLNAKESTQNNVSASKLSYSRSDLIKTYALTRARGKCEGCEQIAPFLKKNNQPYLEIHHLDELSNNGSDSPKNVIALCPNCHARVTHGIDGEAYNSSLKSKIKKIEEDFDYKK